MAPPKVGKDPNVVQRHRMIANVLLFLSQMTFVFPTFYFTVRFMVVFHWLTELFKDKNNYDSFYYCGVFTICSIISQKLFLASANSNLRMSIRIALAITSLCQMSTANNSLTHFHFKVEYAAWSCFFVNGITFSYAMIFGKFRKYIRIDYRYYVCRTMVILDVIFFFMTEYDFSVVKKLEVVQTFLSTTTIFIGMLGTRTFWEDAPENANKKN